MDLEPSVLKVWDPPEPFIISGFSVQDSYAYVNLMDGILGAQTNSPLAILDVRDPTKPQQVATYHPRGFVRSFEMTFSGSTAYLLLPSSQLPSGLELEIVDLADPLAPRRLGGLEIGEVHSARLFVSGGYAYVVRTGVDMPQPSTLEIIDVSTPESPRRVGFCDLGGEWSYIHPPSGLAIVGNLLLVTGSARELQLVDVSDPAHPIVVGRHPILSWMNAPLAVRGHLAFVGLPLGLAVIDFSDPANPFEIARSTVEEALEGSYASSVSIVDHLVYVRLSFMGGQGALHIFDITKPSEPKLVARHRDTEKVVLAANRLWTTASGGLALLDVSKPAALQRIGNFRHAGVQDFAVSDNSAFLACELEPALLVLDVSRPSEATRIGAYHLPGAGGLSVAISDHRAYLVSGRWGREYPSPVESAKLEILDVLDPRNPRLLGSCDLDLTYVAQWGWQGIQIAVAGTHAFLRANEGLEIVDVADPSAPKRVAALPFAVQPDEWAREFAVSDGVAYILFVRLWSSRVIALDVTVPGNPRQLSEVQLPEYAFSLTVMGNLLCVGEQGLKLFDISDPANPRQIGRLESASGSPIAGFGSFAYFGAPLSQQGSSLEVLDLRNLDQLQRIRGNTSLEGWRIRRLHVQGDHLYALSGENEGLTILNAYRETRLGIPIHRADGKIELPLVGPPFHRIPLQRSNNLLDWDDWQTVTLGDSPGVLIDDSASASQRFYRTKAETVVP